MQIVKKSLDAFWGSDMHVAVLKGKWGVGKPFFWDDYIGNFIKSDHCQQIAYSYISLFGKSNLEAIKQSIFHSSKPIKSESIIDERFDSFFEEKSRMFRGAFPFSRF